MALIGDFGESLYPQLPNQTIHPQDTIELLPEETRDYHIEGRKKWERLKETFISVDYSLMEEGGDKTSNPIQEVACGGGQCEII